MLTCRLCHEPATKSVSSWGNERVVITYTHIQSDGAEIEHRHSVMSCDGERIAAEDRKLKEER
jgi:hypothetical protein